METPSENILVIGDTNIDSINTVVIEPEQEIIEVNKTDDLSEASNHFNSLSTDFLKIQDKNIPEDSSMVLDSPKPSNLSRDLSLALMGLSAKKTI